MLQNQGPTPSSIDAEGRGSKVMLWPLSPVQGGMLELQEPWREVSSLCRAT